MAKVKKTCQTRINQTKEDEARALQELEKERELTKSVIMGNKNYEHKVSSLSLSLCPSLSLRELNPLS